MRVAVQRLRQTRPTSKDRLFSEIHSQSCSRPCIFSRRKWVSTPHRCEISHQASPSSRISHHEAGIGSQYVYRSGNAQEQGNDTKDPSTGGRRASRMSRHRDGSNVSIEQRQDPQSWVRKLTKYLLHYSRPARTATTSMEHTSNSREILSILHTARKPYNAGIDILTYMITHGERKAALQLCDLLLQDLVSRDVTHSSDSLPSNVSWPKEESFSSITRSGIDLPDVSRPDFEPCESWSSQSFDPRYSSTMSKSKDPTMDQIWFTLGSLVVQSADMPENESHRAMNAAQLLLSKVHNLNLVPDNVYAYHTPTHSTTLRRPPTVHLLSSRILTSLSDAAWRVHQEESIEKAASHGLTYEEIGRDPPGGRYRLKVRPMGPEIWLEFILWCCVEGGFESAGQRIISQLQSKTQNPWFAITWSTDNGTGFAAPRIDWERVKSRTGGTVGRLEGYSKGQPLAEIPPRTISTEVVLALVEAHINTVRLTENGNGIALEAAQHGIVKLISFLEPHDLPVSYFDYISARLLMTEAFGSQRGTDPQSQSKSLKKWLDRLTILKSLKTIRDNPPPMMSFQLEPLLVHSEFAAGFMHQVLDSFVQDGNIHDALRVFNDLQKLVDNSKLHAIGAFLRRTVTPESSFFSSRGFTNNPEFIDSHGQLPLYKLAGLLNLAIDSNLVGFGQWLLYSDDPDGPLIPRRVYGNAAIARSLVRFAALSNDVHLWTEVSSPRLAGRKFPTVNFLRTTFNARLLLLDINGALRTLRQLSKAQGGGYGLSNLSQLAGLILKLEKAASQRMSAEPNEDLSQATRMLDGMLMGRFDGRSGALQRSVRTTFRQQVTHLLTVFESFSDSAIATIATRNRDRYRATNIANLSAPAFNDFLEAVLEVEGAAYATELVDAFCQTNIAGDTDIRALSGDHTGEQQTEVDAATDAAVLENSSQAGENDSDKAKTAERFIPFVRQPVEGATNNVPAMETDPSQSNSDENPTGHTGQVPAPSSQKEIQFSSPYFQVQEGYPIEDNVEVDHGHKAARSVMEPICVFDSRTIRLVVRRAMQEQGPSRASSGRAEHRQSKQQYAGILQWARRKFVELGFTTSMMSNEIREPITERGLTGSGSVTSLSPTPAKRRARGRSRVSKAFGGENKA